MSIALLITSFLAGLLTVIAPCVLPLLPIIVGGSLLDRQRWRPFVIALSLGCSVIVFTLLLKTFTLFINVPAAFWTYLSAVIIILFGLVLLFPSAWDWLSIKLHFSQSSEQMLQRASLRSSIWGAVLLGASLGPVFSSCSPTYFVILATILPVSFFAGFIYLCSYAFGLALILLLISLLGQTLTTRLKFAANPNGWFKKMLGVVLIIVGLIIALGLDKQAENYLILHGFGSTTLERNLLKNVNVHITDTQPVIKQTTSNIALPPTAMWSDANAGTLADFGAAPELVGLTNWINSQPLTLAALRGKVVLIDFWTYSCINCIRTLPYLESWHKHYASQGLVIIGLSDPEFQFEKKPANVLAAVRSNGLTYPIALDNDHATWNAYHNSYWPAKYLIDRQGHLRYYHFGEGEYTHTEQIIQTLLQTPDKNLVSTHVTAPTAGNVFLTNETYLGSYRRDNLATWGSQLSNGEWAINTLWNSSNPERITTTKAGAALMLNFYASTANIVLDGVGTAQIILDGKPLVANAGSDVHNGMLNIKGARLYQITNFGNNYQQHTVEMIFNQANISAYSWTFG